MLMSQVKCDLIERADGAEYVGRFVKQIPKTVSTAGMNNLSDARFLAVQKSCLLSHRLEEIRGHRYSGRCDCVLQKAWKSEGATY